MVGLTLDSLDTVFEKEPRRRVQTLLLFDGRFLLSVFNTMKSVMSDQFRKSRCFTEGFRNPFVLTAVKFFNWIAVEVFRTRS